MKKLKKILSSVLAVSIVLSCGITSVFADNTAKTRNITITATKTDGSPATDLVADDKIIVEVKIADIASLTSLEYDLNFDRDAFTIDTSTGTYGQSNYIDGNWYFNILIKQDVLGKYLSTTSYRPQASDADKDTIEYIHYTFNGSEQVPDADTNTNVLVGKYTFTAKDVSSTGKYSYDFTLTGKTSDQGKTIVSPVTCTPVTVTFAGGEEETFKVEETAVKGNGKYYGNDAAITSIKYTEAEAPKARLGYSADGTTYTWAAWKDLPAVKGSGATKILAIINYKLGGVIKAEAEKTVVPEPNGTFMLEVNDGDTLKGTATYKIPAAE